MDQWRTDWWVCKLHNMVFRYFASRFRYFLHFAGCVRCHYVHWLFSLFLLMVHLTKMATCQLLAYIACSTVSMVCTVLGTHCIVVTVRESHNWPVTASHQSVCSRCSEAERVCDNNIEEARIHYVDVWRWHKLCRCFEARSRWSVNRDLLMWFYVMLWA